MGRRFLGDGDPVLDQVATVSREVLEAICRRFTVGRLSGLITLELRSGRRQGSPGMVRVVLELRCVKCAVKFERTFEERRRQLNYSEGEMLQLDKKACPNHCGGDWFSIEKSHPIRKFKCRF